jgi:hypothetical protein
MFSESSSSHDPFEMPEITNPHNPDESGQERLLQYKNTLEAGVYAFIVQLENIMKHLKPKVDDLIPLEGNSREVKVSSLESKFITAIEDVHAIEKYKLDLENPNLKSLIELGKAMKVQEFMSEEQEIDEFLQEAVMAIEKFENMKQKVLGTIRDLMEQCTGVPCLGKEKSKQ